LVDRATRDALAELTHHFVAGRLTNYELENRRPRSKDPAIQQIFWNALWGLYDDLHEHRLIGCYYIPKDSRSDLARCILFLKSDLEYEWTPFPPKPQALAVLVSMVTLGAANRVMLRHWRRQGDASVWPFMREVDYRRALQQPPYLACAS